MALDLECQLELADYYWIDEEQKEENAYQRSAKRFVSLQYTFSLSNLWVCREVNQRFSSKNRLANTAQFDEVFKKSSKTLKTKEFLFLLKGNLMEENRLGIIVSKKHVPLSVERNRLRRLIREGFRTILNPGLGIDLLVLVRPGINKNNNHWVLLKNLFLSVNSEELGNKFWNISFYF